MASSIEQLFEQYYICVRSIARVVLHGKQQDIEDVIQETFLDVWRNLGQFDESRGTMKTWISSIAYHRATKRYRVLRRRGEVDIIAALEIADERQSISFKENIGKLLLKLTAKQRQVIEQHLLNEQPIEQVAEAIHETPGNTRNLFYRGLAKLQKAVQP